MFNRRKIHTSRIGNSVALAIVAALVAASGGCGVLKDLRDLRDQVGAPLPFDTGGAVFVDATDTGDELPPRLDTGGEAERDTDRDWDTDEGTDASPVPDVTFDEPPLISEVFPRSGPTRGGTFVSVLGARFDWGTRVYLGGVEVERIDIIDEYELFFVTPPLDAGPHDLKITASGGSAALENAFTAVESLSVTSVSPGNTLSEKRTLMLLKKRGSLFENVLMTCRAA